jgi:hypothetical protein
MRLISLSLQNNEYKYKKDVPCSFDDKYTSNYAVPNGVDLDK